MTIKPGVRVFGVRPEIVLAMISAQAIYAAHGKSLTVTSIVDGKHSRGSKHYSGCAMDLRTRDLEAPDVIADELRAALGADFDVILESDHIHVEYDPKEPLS